MTKPRKPQDLEGIKSDVASFASSLGLASSLPNSGFNDTDFRKTGPLRKHQRLQKSSKNDREKTTEKPHERKQQRPKPKPGVSVLPLPAENSTIFGKFKNLPTLPLVKAGSLGVWYVDARELEERVIGKVRNLEVKSVEEWKRMVEKKRELGQRLIAQYTRDYEVSKGQSGDIKMLMATQRSGTAADKVSAFAVLIGENPIANSRSLDALLAMVTSKVGKRHALIGFDTLKELFVSSLLPDCKLKSLLQQPVNHLPETKDGYSLLLFWYWEECLRQRYERFVNALDEASRDVLPALKDKAMKTMYVLLKSKAEQERKLLYFLVNKLGDPQSKSASSADFHLANLLSEHPNMKAVVIDEVDSFLFRPHLGIRAKYHAVNFLSQFRLTHKGDGPKVAKRLIDVYFVLFKVLISEADQAQNVDKKSKQKDNWRDSSSRKGSKAAGLSESHVELDSRLLSALLTGINRAFPYVSSSEADDIIEVQTPMLFKLVHSKNFNVGVQALMLLDKISSKNQVLSDRFYRALYSKLLLPAAMNSSKVEMFFGLLSRAMRNDINAKRVSAFSKRLLQVALQQPPEYACGCLFLLSEILKARPPLRNMMLQNESIDEDLEHFEDIIEEDNHPITVSSNNSFHCSEDSSNGENKGASTRTEDDISNEEGNPHGEDKFEKQEPIKNAPATSFRFPGGYNPRHREPSFCNADCVGWWELTVLASHVHPSVATMARTLLSGAQIVYEGNPLNDLSLAAFLDKFMEKKPKPITWHGASQIEPANASKLELNHHLIGPEILSLAEVDVPPEDLVFHKFYTNKMNSSKKPKKKKKKKPTEDEIGGELFDVGGDESDNEEIEQMLDSDHPGFKADVDYNYDDLDQLNEEDADLVGDNSDAEMDALSDVADGEDFDAMDDIDPTAEEASGSEDRDELKRTKRKLWGKAGLSPFASIEEYEHLLNEDNLREEDSRSKRKKKKLKSGKTKR